MKDYSFLLHMQVVVRFHFCCCWKLSLSLSLWSLEVLDMFVQAWIHHAQTKNPAMWKLLWWFPSNQWLVACKALFLLFQLWFATFCYFFFFYITYKGLLLLMYHWYNSPATKNKEGSSAFNRGCLIDKLAAAKPALANCLSNALINQTEE